MSYEHEHKYFIFQVKAEFEAVSDGTCQDLALHYTRKEYAILGCSCGNVIKKPVQEQA